MKRLLIIAVMVLSSLVVVGQDWYPTNRPLTTWEKVERPIYMTLWTVGASMIGAYGDAIRDDGKPIGWALNGVEAAMYVGGKWLFKLDGPSEHIVYLVGVGFARAATFDHSYNMFRGLPSDHVGTVKKWDGFWSRQTPQSKNIFHGFCGVVTISIYFGEF